MKKTILALALVAFTIAHLLRILPGPVSLTYWEIFHFKHMGPGMFETEDTGETLQVIKDFTGNRFIFLFLERIL
jgi:hypothetical protein